MARHRKRGVWRILLDAGLTLIVFMAISLIAIAVGVAIAWRPR